MPRKIADRAIRTGARRYASRPGTAGSPASAPTILLLAALLLGGCGALRDGPPAATEARGRDNASASTPDTERLLAQFETARLLPAAELARETEAARRALAAESGDANRLRYAMLLALAGTDDTGRALDVLEPVARNRASPHHALAVMLRSLLSRTRQSETELAEARRKLESIKALEKSLSERAGAIK